ncbi:MAG TPA: hypothetical protein ENH55_10770 [Aurantimonas coralicida]|uniref:Uncharacterized protein n=2 Tax=root TaxID=1 RepID=A0A9C9NDG7_9HYPH|nr:hypothetical protein [Aurantimonas coralicida]HET99455.1 hypothetical protein [Aurantimonas coralicida]
MSNAMQEAVEEAVVRIQSNGTVLDVNRLAQRLVATQGGAGRWIQDEVALELIRAASRRQVAMEFHEPSV